MRLGTSPKVIKEDVHALGVDAVVLYDDAGAADDFAGVTLLIDRLACKASSTLIFLSEAQQRPLAEQPST